MKVIRICILFVCVMTLTSCGTFKYRASREVKIKSLPYTHFYLADQKSKPTKDGYMDEMGALKSKKAKGVMKYLGSSDAEGNAVLTMSTKAYKRGKRRVYAIKSGFEPQKFKLRKQFNTLVLLDIIYPASFFFDKYTILSEKKVNELYLNQKSQYDCFEYLAMAEKEQNEERKKELLWLAITQDYMNEYGVKAVALTSLANMEVGEKDYHKAYLLLKEIKRHDSQYDISSQLNWLQAYINEENQKIQKRLDRMMIAANVMSAMGNSLSANAQTMNAMQGGMNPSQNGSYYSTAGGGISNTKANNYQVNYDNWARLAQRHYNSIVNTGGTNVTDKNGNVVGVAGKRSAGNYVAAKRAYSKAQLEMRNIRREAEANGVKIVVSQWENIPIKPGN